MYVEVKAIFNDSKEAQKYPWIIKALNPNEKLLFVFEKPDKPIHWKAKRKDGTKMTMAQWADKNKIEWFSEEAFIKLLTECPNQL